MQRTSWTMILKLLKQLKTHPYLKLMPKQLRVVTIKLVKKNTKHFSESSYKWARWRGSFEWKQYSIKNNKT